MKKLVISILAILGSGTLCALPVGNPSEASLFKNGLLWQTTGCCDPCDPCFNWCDAWSFRIGYYGDFVFNRHLEIGDEDHDNSSGGDLERARLSTNAGYFALNFCDRLDIFVTLGATSFYTRQNENVFATVLGPFESESFYSTRFSWSIGARATLFECGCFALGAEGQYFTSHPRFDHFVDYSTGAKFYFNDFRTHYKEWQVGLGLSYRIATNCPTLAFIPYTAVKYARVHWDVDDTHLFPTLATPFLSYHSKKHWGWALGLTFTLCDAAGITTEARFGDEKAFYLNGQCRF